MKYKNSILNGACRFGLLGVLAFSVWMAPLKLSTFSLYTAIIAVFMVGAGVLFYPLFKGEKRLFVCYKTFLPAFLLYSVLWCLGWFGIGGVEGELLGSASGLAAFAFIVQKLYLKSDSKSFLNNWAVLFLFHTLGYTLGGMFYYGTNGSGLFSSFMEGHRVLGGLLWGLCYGLGFGAGFGALLNHKTI